MRNSSYKVDFQFLFYTDNVCAVQVTMESKLLSQAQLSQNFGSFASLKDGV